MDERKGFNVAEYLDKTINELAGVKNGDLMQVVEIPLSEIEPNRYQPRKHFDKRALNDLADSIKENGVIQPILVTRLLQPKGEVKYEIIGGERRWRASQIAGKATIPSIVKQVDDLKLRTIATIENTQREDLTNIEKAVNIYNLKQDYNDIELLSRYLALDRKTIEKYIRVGKAVTANAEVSAIFESSKNTDFTLLYDFAKYIEKLQEFEKSNNRLYYSIIKGLKKNGPTKDGLKYLQKRFSQKSSSKEHDDNTGLISCDFKGTEKELMFYVRLKKGNITSDDIGKINRSIEQFTSALAGLLPHKTQNDLD
jgi:ParB/RepB/Spo0J family partition protein